MPVVVIIDGLPIVEALRLKQRIGRGVQHEMKFASHSANPLQRAPQLYGEVKHISRSGQAETLEGRFMGPGNDPGLIGYARRIRAERDKVAAHFDDPLVLLQLLGNNVTEYTALLGLEIIPARP